MSVIKTETVQGKTMISIQTGKEEAPCCGCGVVCEVETMSSLGGQLYCDDCGEDIVCCEGCGEMLNVEHMRYVEDDGYYCNQCFEDAFVSCRDCGDVIRNDRATDVGDSYSFYYVCSSCLEDYIRCDDCDGWVLFSEANPDDEDEDNYYCDDCYPKHKSIIRAYHDSPSLVFYGTSNKKYGVELEMENVEEEEDNEDIAEEIRNAVNDTEWERYEDEALVYFNRDGSLDDGFEMITHPMDYDFISRINWEKVLGCAADLGMRGHDTSTCGLHVHVSRAAFGSSREEQEEAVARLMFIFESHWDKIVRFSRRTEEALNRWAARYLGETEEAKKVYKYKEHAQRKCGSRYHCVNNMNRATVEIRIFRSTLLPETFRATIEFVHLITEAAIHLSDEQVEEMSFMDLLADASENLMTYLKKRGICES